MRWEVEIAPRGRDTERERVCDEFDRFTQSHRGDSLVVRATRGYLLDGPHLTEADLERLTETLLLDPIVEIGQIRPVDGQLPTAAMTVLLKPGVTDPAATSVVATANDLGIPVAAVRTFRRYYGPLNMPPADQELLVRKVLANGAIEQVVFGTLTSTHFGAGHHYAFRRVVVKLSELNDAELVKLSQTAQLALTREEMRTIQAHFLTLGRDPTDCELETLAQTWSEHCSHKTLKSAIRYTETLPDGTVTMRNYQNLLKETVFAATTEIRARLGADDWCVSVFSDNAGVVTFDEQFHLCVKVETHNRPSAIEPYGGANTGLGGVIRDVLGTALGGTPVANTDVFCFAPPDTPAETLPPGVLHPRQVMLGVVAGVRDYGNRMGIPTVNGAVVFDERYLANPLVFCGTIGLVPVNRVEKRVSPGDLIVALGGRTGRDGIHGATFSSLGLTAESEVVSGGAVQIGHPIQEKMVHDVLLQARDQGLFSAVTDCGAGGFSSAIGEMAADTGAIVHLDRALLKYEGLSYTEVWISESQERMVLAVPPEKWKPLQALAASEGVEAVTLGTFTDTGRLELFWETEPVADLGLAFLHDGRPAIEREAQYSPPVVSARPTPAETLSPTETLTRILSAYSVCSKEWIVRQYDHEVQGGSVLKPLVGADDDGPGDAAVVAPVLGSPRGFAVGNGLNPRYADLDPWAAAACALDEAVRNVVAVGADPNRIAILDNFCWSNVADPANLGALVRTAEACREVAIAYGTPFVSGKDSLNNEYKSAGIHIAIPHTLLITSLGLVPDVTRCVSMDLKAAGNALYILGPTADQMGGSHFHLVNSLSGGTPPVPNLLLAPKIFQALHTAIQAGCVRACHDLSEGGLAVAAAEMAFAGGVGLDIGGLAYLPTEGTLTDDVKLFSESPTRFLVEVPPSRVPDVEHHFGGLPFAKIGVTVAEPRLRIAGTDGEWIVWVSLTELKAAWQAPLRW